MRQFLPSLSPLALLLLAACSTYEPVTPAPAPVAVTPAPAVVAPPAPPATVAVVPQPGAGQTVIVPPTPPALRAGIGRVESIIPVPQTSASAGGTAPGPLNRLGIRMADGTLQYVDTAAASIAVGDRVELTADRHLRHPVP